MRYGIGYNRMPALGTAGIAQVRQEAKALSELSAANWALGVCRCVKALQALHSMLAAAMLSQSAACTEGGRALRAQKWASGSAGDCNSAAVTYRVGEEEHADGS